MDPSKMTFLQSVLRYTTSHTDQSSQPATEGVTREMSPEVSIIWMQ